jgi:hypothetical protein
MDVVREHADDSGETVTVSLTPEYKTNAGSIARKRAVEAGFRLAKSDRGSGCGIKKEIRR